MKRGTLFRIPKNSKILDIGSGTGRDADYTEAKGFHVTRTDKEPGWFYMVWERS